MSGNYIIFRTCDSGVLIARTNGPNDGWSLSARNDRFIIANRGETASMICSSLKVSDKGDITE